MWNWFNCYLSGRHSYSMWCESGAMFLRCVHCGKRSAGWSVSTTSEAKPSTTATPIAHASERPRVVPFGRVALR